MSNSYSTYTAADLIPCTPEQLKELQAMLIAASEEEDQWHGFTIDDSAGPGKDGKVFAYLYTQESGNPEELPEDFLELFGKLIGEAGLTHLEVGVAFTCSRMIPGTHGGSAIRILPDGSIIDPLILWPDMPHQYALIKDIPPPPELTPGWYRHYKGGVYEYRGQMTWNTLHQAWWVTYHSRTNYIAFSRDYESFVGMIEFDDDSKVPRYTLCHETPDPYNP